MSNIQNQEQQSAKQIIGNAERLRFAHNIKTYSRFGYLALGVAGLSFGMSFLNYYYYQGQAQQTVDFRKSRLQQPVIELSNQDGTTIPWSSKSVDQYAFRKVRITGRPLHNRTCLIPAKQHNLDGYYYVVPLCTKETEEGVPIEGVLLNKGFIPQYYGNVAHRSKIEDSFHQQTFDAYVSYMEESQGHSALQPGNNSQFERGNTWSYVDLKEMANVTGFQNLSTAGACVLESVNFDTPLNERDMHITDIDSDYRQDYPYRKTMSGALQTTTMPWDARNTASNYFSAGIASAILGFTLIL